MRKSVEILVSAVLMQNNAKVNVLENAVAGKKINDKLN